MVVFILTWIETILASKVTAMLAKCLLTPSIIRNHCIGNWAVVVQPKVVEYEIGYYSFTQVRKVVAYFNEFMSTKVP